MYTLSEGSPEPVQPSLPEPTIPYKASVYVNLDGDLIPPMYIPTVTKILFSFFLHYFVATVVLACARCNSVVTIIFLTHSYSTFPFELDCARRHHTYQKHPRNYFGRRIVLYNNGDLAFLANIGVLQQPLDVSQKGNS